MHRLFEGKHVKRKVRASPSLLPSSSGEEDTNPVSKRICLTSPARVIRVASAKASKTSSSSKGLAGFAALVNNANLSAARAETGCGLRPGSSSSKAHGGVPKSKVVKTVSI